MNISRIIQFHDLSMASLAQPIKYTAMIIRTLYLAQGCPVSLLLQLCKIATTSPRKLKTRLTDAPSQTVLL